MKRYNLIILLMFLSVCAFAQTENNIIGTWRFLKINAIVETNSEEAKNKIIKDIKSQIEPDSDIYMQFTQEGRWITSGSAENTGFYSVDRGMLTDLNTNVSIPYIINKDTLVFDIDFNKFDTYNIHKLENMDIVPPESIIIDRAMAKTYFIRTGKNNSLLDQIIHPQKE